MSNADQKALKEYVDRMFNIESAFLDAKNERDDMVKDLKGEIKNKAEETGVDPKEVVRLAKIRLAEHDAREKSSELSADLTLYDVLYGRSSADEVDDPLA